MNQWLSWSQQTQNFGMFGFLTKLNENGFKRNSFRIIESMVSSANIDSSHSNGNDNISRLFERFKKDKFVANCLLSKLKKESLMDIKNVVNNGVVNQECAFNDSLLYLSRLVNNMEFNKIMEDVTDECLNSDKKTVKKYQFFKNNLLNSNIWAVNATDETDTDSKTNADQGKVILSPKF